MEWTADNIVCGTMVAKQWAGGKRFYTPLIISYHNLKGGQVFGLTCLRDGMFMQFGEGSRLELAEQMNKSGYIPCIKAHFSNDGDTKCIENRAHVPVVLITHGEG